MVEDISHQCHTGFNLENVIVIEAVEWAGNLAVAEVMKAVESGDPAGEEH